MRASNLVEAPFHLLLLNVSVALHRALCANLAAPAKLPDRILDDVDDVLRAHVKVGVALAALARDAKLALAVVQDLALRLDERVPRPGRALDVLDDLQAVRHGRRRAARLVLKRRPAAVVLAVGHVAGKLSLSRVPDVLSAFSHDLRASVSLHTGSRM